MFNYSYANLCLLFLCLGTAMYRAKYSEMLENPEILDYGAYLQCDTLLQCQKPLESLCNSDELQFQIVHQVEELWMKLMIYSLIDVLEYMQKQENA